MKLSEKLKEKNQTIYQKMAEKHGVSVDFVGKIARGQRKATRGIGLAVKEDLEKLIN